MVDTLAHPEASAQALLVAAELALGQLKAPEPATTPVPSAPEAPPLRRVLVVDDDPSLRQLLQRLLEREGYQVACAQDGEEALSLLHAAAPPELMLLDLHMPRRSGLDVLKAMAELPARPRTLMLSAQARDADVVRALERGAADFVAKPFSTATLLARLARLARAPGRS